MCKWISQISSKRLTSSHPVCWAPRTPTTQYLFNQWNEQRISSSVFVSLSIYSHYFHAVKAHLQMDWCVRKKSDLVHNLCSTHRVPRMSMRKRHGIKTKKITKRPRPVNQQQWEWRTRSHLTRMKKRTPEQGKETEKSSTINIVGFLFSVAVF